MEERIREQLKIHGYGHLDDNSVFRLCHPIEFQNDTRTLGTFGDYEKTWFSLPTSEPVPTDRPRLPDKIRDLAHALTILDTARWYISRDQLAGAIEHIFLGTAVAMRGGAELLREEEASQKGHALGKLSGQKRREQASRAWPVYDEYLRRAAEKQGDGHKTDIAKRALRLLSKDCERYEQSRLGDEDASRIFAERVPAALGELLREGWKPPKSWQTLDNRWKVTTKQ